MKVLLVGPGKVHGGVESHILSLVEGFRGTDVECHVVMLNGTWSIPGVPLQVLHKRFRGDWQAVTRIRDLVREASIDILHTHYLGPNLYGRIAARLCRNTGLITTAHFSNSGGIVRPGKKKPTLADEGAFWLDTVMAHGCDRIVVPSDVIRTPLARVRYPSNRIVTIPHGLDLNRFRINREEGGRARAELGIPEDAVAIGVIGRLVPVKNIPMFLSAMERVMAGSKERVVAVVVGDGPLRAALEEQAQGPGLRGRVHFTGFRGDVERMLAALDVVAVSSDSELAPLGAWEAMAAGRPVVATSVGALTATIHAGQNGLLVKPGDVEGMAEALTALVCDASLRARLGEAARHKAEHSFSRKAMIEHLRTVYEEVIRERTARRRAFD